MLKIKDTVDLLELQRYGFRNNTLTLRNKKIGETTVEVNEETREVTLWWENYFNDSAEQYILIDVVVLFDLIKDGLIEKV